MSVTQDSAADLQCTRDDGRGRSCGAYQRHGSFIAPTKHDCTAARCIFKRNISFSGHKRETVAFPQRRLLLRSAANCTVSIFSFFDTCLVTISLAHCPIYMLLLAPRQSLFFWIVFVVSCRLCAFVGRCVKSTGLAFGIYCPAVPIRYLDNSDVSVERVHGEVLKFQSEIFKRTLSHHVSSRFLVHHITLYTRAAQHVW